jgi:hypothetical protein
VDASQCEDMFFEHVPEQFLQRTVRMVFASHKQAWDETKARFAATEADNLRGHYRRGIVEGGLREVADLHVDDGLTHRVVKAEGTNWNHTEILAGPVLITATTVQTPCGPVDKAEFRKGLAKSNTESLFEEPASLFEDDVLSRHLFVMLLHSRYRSALPERQAKYAHLPGSAYLAFPAADLNSYLHEVNLFDRYPDIVASQLPQEWDEQAVVTFMHNARKSAWLHSA